MKQIIINLPCVAFVTTGYFNSKSVSSLKTNTQKGIVTDFDEKSNYVVWEIDGIEQPTVNINCVGFILK